MSTPNAEYWAKRQQQLLAAMAADEKKLTAALDKYFAAEARALDKEIAAYYARYGKDGVIEYRNLLVTLDTADRQLLMQQMDAFALKHPEYAHLMPVRESIYKLNRLEGLHQTLYIQQMEMGMMTRAQLEKHLMKYAEAAYKGASGFNAVDRSIISRLVGANWLDGKNFSERIWGIGSKLAGTLLSDFRNGVIRGDSYDRMTKMLQDKFSSVSKNDAYRLIYTEGTYVHNQSALEAWKEMGYTHYRYAAIGDGKACEICAGLSGQVFRIDAASPGESFPPMHPWCRCSHEVVTEKGEDGESNIEEFEPANDLVGAEKYAKDALGLDSVDFSGVNIDLANEINKEILNAQKIFPGVKDTIQNIAVQPSGSRGYMSYDEASRTLRIPRFAGKDPLGQMRYTAEQQKLMGWWSTGETMQAGRHEIGHGVNAIFGAADRFAKEHAVEELRRQVLKDITGNEMTLFTKTGYIAGGKTREEFLTDVKKAGNIISGYALQGKNEFIAESVAEVLGGKPRFMALKVFMILMG